MFINVYYTASINILLVSCFNLRYNFLMKPIFFLSLLVLFFSSCAARINGSILADGSATMNVSMALEPRITSLIRTFTVVGGQTEGVVLDGQAIALSMDGAPGISSITLRNTAAAAIEGVVVINNINEFLSVSGGNRDFDGFESDFDEETAGNGFFSFEQGASGGSLSVNINLENSPQILELLSPEISVYLEALMAPIATGEEMGKDDYLELVSMIYNQVISDEIASSRFRAVIEFPGRVSSVRGGTSSGRRATFDIPLLDILVLEEPLSYEVRWR